MNFNILSVIFFFFFNFSLGLGLTFFSKNSKNFFERNFMRIGIGLGIMPILFIFFNLFKIPLDWRIFFLISVMSSFFGLWKWKKYKFKFQKIGLTKSNIYSGIVLILFLGLFFVMYKGSFTYPWFENGDPYEHTISANYIAHQKTFSKPIGMYIAHYTEPYVQGFPIFMGLMKQLSGSIVWTLKFYNALLVALSIPFFYFFVKRFTQNPNLALFAAFALTAIPSFQSHFIFAETLALTLFFPAFYCIEMLKEDWRWLFPASMIIASIMITQQLSAFNFGIFFIIYFISHLVFLVISIKEIKKEERTWVTRLFITGLIGLALSGLFFVPIFTKYTLDEVKYQYTLTEEIDPEHEAFWKFSDTHAIKYYTVKDFIIAPLANKTDNPTGFGWVLFVLTSVGLFYFFSSFKEIKQNKTLWVTFFWLVFSFLMVMGDRLPFRILPNRNWAFLSISVVIFAAYGWAVLSELGKKFWVYKYALLILLIIGISLTSFKPKIIINTSQWAPHVFRDQNELGSYLWIKDKLPPESFIFDFCSRDYKLMASDMMSPIWDKRLYELRHNASQKPYGWDSEVFELMGNVSISPMMALPPEELRSELVQLGIRYFIISSECIQKFGENATNQRITELFPYFKREYASQNMIIFSI